MPRSACLALALISLAFVARGASGAAAPTDTAPRLKVPSGFAPMPIAIGATAAAAPGDPAAKKELLASYARGEESLHLSRIAQPLGGGPELRDHVAKQVVDHFRDALGLELRLLWATKLERPAGAIEVAGRFALDGVERGTVIAFVPGGDSTYVILASAPLDRVEAIALPVEEAARELEVVETETTSSAAETWILSFAALATLAGIVAWARSRRRRGLLAQD